jgi:hypothetical protein
VANRWTPAEIAHLKDLAARHSAAEIAEKLDRTVGGVTFKAHQINLTLLCAPRTNQSHQADRTTARRRASPRPPH